jgi:hypothetical protein
MVKVRLALKRAFPIARRNSDRTDTAAASRSQLAVQHARSNREDELGLRHCESSVAIQNLSAVSGLLRRKGSSQ